MGAEASVAYGTSAGGLCLDRDRWGGNPFATSFVGLVGKRPPPGRDPLPLEVLLTRLRSRTRRASNGVQDPECHVPTAQASWIVGWSPVAELESRLALVLIVSDYSATPWQSLPGAALDQRRVSGVLAAQGFSVIQGVGATAESLEDALARFGRESSRADSAVIYSTGHGLMVGDTTYLIPGSSRGTAAPMLDAASVARIGIPVSRMISAARARTHNLVLFAGCRRQARTRDEPS